ncbi:MAG: Uma2 family endonuclease [Bacteroidota bacterium]
MALTSIDQVNPNGYYTYQDYLGWDFPERVELYKGKPFELSPAPSRRHQEISVRLLGRMFNHFQNSPCHLFSAPFDVRLPVPSKNGKPDTVVQPDLCVICDESKLDQQGCNGAPDLVIEILSPGNPKREVREKFSLYEEAGVREYWVVQPSEGLVIAFILNEEGRFIGQQPRTALDALTSHVFPDLSVDVGEILGEE